MPENNGKEESPPFVEAVVAGANIGSNASLAGKVGEALRELARSGPVPEKYFRVHDLNNPAAAYWSRKAPDVEESTDTARRLAFGKRLHRQAGYRFRALPGFVLGEGRLEGAYVGVRGVVGRVDFLLGRSILEYKTKDAVPEDTDQLWSQYPQDIEQTAFYGVLLPDSSDTHYLVFESGVEIRAFRLRIRDRDAVKNVLTRRMKDLREAISRDDPTRLGRCRYVDAGCKFVRAEVCGCANLPLLEITELRAAVELTRDAKFEEQVREASAHAAFPEREIWWLDLFSPRRRFLETPPSYTSGTGKTAARWLLEEGVKAMGLSPGHESYRAAAAGAAALGIRAPSGLLRTMRAREGSEVVPFVARAQRGSVKREWQVTQWFIAELAVACAAADSVRGVIFVVYPDDDSKVAAYDVSFPDLGRVKELVRESVRKIHAAENAKDPSLVRECPAFMRDECSSACLCRSTSVVVAE